MGNLINCCCEREKYSESEFEEAFYIYDPYVFQGSLFKKVPSNESSEYSNCTI